MNRAWQRHADELQRRPIVVLFGGRSSEREVSLKSGAAVAAALESRPAEASEPRTAHVYRAQIELDGQWLFDGKRLPAGEALARLSPSTLFFLANGPAEAELLAGAVAERMGIPAIPVRAIPTPAPSWIRRPAT